MKMKKATQKGWRDAKNEAVLLSVGGGTYGLLEILWRGHTHPSMVLVGGVCFRLMGAIYRAMNRCSRLWRCAACGAAVTAVEFVSGCFLNRLCRLNVWDYSRQRGNLMGQICPLYSLLWAGLSLWAAPLCCRLADRLSGRRGGKRF